MKYLMVRNLGVADYRGFTLLGVSTTRDAGLRGTIGQFGSGSKYALALLMRRGVIPTVVCGNLKMSFFIKKQVIQEQVFQQVCVTYSGKLSGEVSKTNTEDLGFTLQWGVQDWTKLGMALREIVSNAIDGSITAGGDHNNVEVEVVDEIRAKGGYTSIFLPYTEDVEKAHKAIKTMFLHFRQPSLLKKKCIDKLSPDSDKVLVYKNGVLVCQTKGKSMFDYNLGNELTLDESRNATTYDVQHSVSKALRDESPEVLTQVIKFVIDNPDSWEAELPEYCLKANPHADAKTITRRQEAFTCAWRAATTPNSVATSGNAGIDSFVENKGFTPVSVPKGWLTVLDSYNIPCESSVLSRNELEGKTIYEPTEEMVDCTARVWKLFESFNLINGKTCPRVKGFNSVMEGGAQTFGYYIPNGDQIYLHTSLAGSLMFKVVLEEVVHYVTGAADNSRDIQDFLFNLVTGMANSVK